jgi:hypothetical protein
MLHKNIWQYKNYRKPFATCKEHAEAPLQPCRTATQSAGKAPPYYSNATYNLRVKIPIIFIYTQKGGNSD